MITFDDWFDYSNGCILIDSNYDADLPPIPVHISNIQSVRAIWKYGIRLLRDEHNYPYLRGTKLKLIAVSEVLESLTNLHSSFWIINLKAAFTYFIENHHNALPKAIG